MCLVRRYGARRRGGTLRIERSGKVERGQNDKTTELGSAGTVEVGLYSVPRSCRRAGRALGAFSLDYGQIKRTHLTTRIGRDADGTKPAGREADNKGRALQLWTLIRSAVPSPETKSGVNFARSPGKNSDTRSWETSLVAGQASSRHATAVACKNNTFL